MNGRISCRWSVNASHGDVVKIRGWFLTYPAPDVFWLIGKDHVIAAPERSTKAAQATTETDDDAERDEVTKGICLKETGERVSLHGLKGVVFRSVEYLGVVSALFLNCVNDSVQDRFREDDFSFRAGKYEGI